MSPVKVKFVQATFVQSTLVHISNISALTEPIWTLDQALKESFWGHLYQILYVRVTFVQATFCPDDICIYQQYIHYYWPNIYQTFWAQIWGVKNFFLTKILSHPNFFGTEIFWTKIFLTQKFLGQNFVRPKLLWVKTFGHTFFDQKLLNQKILGTKFIWI